jgi:hypothetical protein
LGPSIRRYIHITNARYKNIVTFRGEELFNQGCDFAEPAVKNISIVNEGRHLNRDIFPNGLADFPRAVSFKTLTVVTVPRCEILTPERRVFSFSSKHSTAKSVRFSIDIASHFKYFQ